MLLIREPTSSPVPPGAPGVKTTSCYSAIVRSPAPPGAPELKLHPVMVKLCALRHRPVSRS